MLALLQGLRRRLEERSTRAWSKVEGTPIGRFAADTLRAARSVVHGFRGEVLHLRAGNLTYITIFSLVPLLTIGVVVLQLYHQATLEQRLTQFVEGILAPGVRAESAAFLRRFVTSASSKAAGGVSFVFLMLSGGMLLRQLDFSLNEIWAVQKRRPLVVSLVLYASLLLGGPVLLGAWLTTASTLQSFLAHAHLAALSLAIEVGSWLASTAALTLLYKLAPHAPVRMRAAFAGGLVGGLGWELAKRLYAEFAGAIFRANPIYGSLSAVPLFLMWIYVSWWLVLFGARLAYAVEHAAYRGEFMDLLSHPRTKELVGARVAQLTAAAVLAQSPGPTVREVANRLKLPPQPVREVVRLLEEGGLLVVGPGQRLVPSRPLEQLTVADISAAVGGVAKLLKRDASASKLEGFQAVEQAFDEIDDAALARLGQLTWAALASSPLQNP